MSKVDTQSLVQQRATLLRRLADADYVVEAGQALYAIELKAYEESMKRPKVPKTRQEEEAQQLAGNRAALTAISNEVEALIPAWIARLLEQLAIDQRKQQERERAIAAREELPRFDLRNCRAVAELQRTLQALGARFDPHLGPVIEAIGALDREADERLAAILEYAGPAAMAALPKLLAILGQRGIWCWPSHLARAIANVSRFDAQVVEALCELLGAGTENVRLAAMEALAAVGPGARSAADRLLAFRKGSAAERCRMIDALARQGSATPVFLDVLEEAVNDSDGYVARSAAYALGELTPDAARFVPLLIAACDRVLHLHNEDLPEAAVAALARYGPRAADALPRLRQFIEGPIRGRTVRPDLVQTAIERISTNEPTSRITAQVRTRTEPFGEHEPLFAVKYQGKQCYIDRRGNFVLQTRFVQGEPFCDGHAIVCDEKRRTFVIDRKGDERFESRWDEINSFSEGLAAVRKGEKWGFVDREGRLVIDPIYDSVSPFSEGLARFEVGRRQEPIRGNLSRTRFGPQGFIGRSGAVVIPARWKAAHSFQEGRAAVGIGETLGDHKFGYLDPTGRLLIPARFDRAEAFSNGRAVVFRSKVSFYGRYGYIDTNGEEIIPLRFRRAWPFHEGLAVARRRGKTRRNISVVFDRAGEVAAELPFAVEKFSEGLAAASSGEEQGFIDLEGNWVIEPQFDLVTPFKDSLAEVQRGNWYGLIDKCGDFVWGPTIEGAICRTIEA